MAHWLHDAAYKKQTRLFAEKEDGNRRQEVKDRGGGSGGEGGGGGSEWAERMNEYGGKNGRRDGQ